MKKRKCYPKGRCYTLLAVTILSGITTIVFPFTFFLNSETSLRILVSLVFLSLTLMNLRTFLWRNQEFYIENGVITVRNCFGVIMELYADECFFMTAKLEDGDEESGGIEPWICIYTKENTEPFFKEGFANSKKYRRIQVVNTKENFEYVKEHIVYAGEYTKPLLEEKNGR